MSFYISKSLYCAGVQCPKLLWLRVNKEETYDTALLDRNVLEKGNEVGDLAMGLFGDYREVPYGRPSEMLDATQPLLDSGGRVIAEASFSYNGLFCSVDILVRTDEGFEIYEVKSSTEVKDINLHDVAYQYHVLTSLGYRIARACLVHIDSAYVRGAELELQGLFAIEDITEKVVAMQPETRERIAMLEAYVTQPEEPVCELGEHCFKPYECACRAYCRRELPVPNVFDLSGMQTRTMLKHYRAGTVAFEALEKVKKLNPNHLLQIRHELYEQPDHIDTEALSAFLDRLHYPLYFLDFESFMPAIPPYEGLRPYRQIVFQYSLHHVDHEGAPLMHTEFLAEPGADPRRALAERLCADIPEGACVMAYNMSFEQARLRELAELCPELSDRLMRIHDSCVDLMVPFREKAWYCRAMQGSFSIKYVLPALCPEDPELDYHSLEGVHNGTEASNTFARMGRLAPEQQAAVREQLLRYCGLDTLAMVKLWERLRQVTGRG